MAWKAGLTAACRHCGRVGRPRARRLCYGCYEAPRVRAMYPPVFTTRTGAVFDMAAAVPDYNGASELPDPDPGLVPGTEAKIAAMEARAAKGQSLFHPREMRLRKRPGRGPARCGAASPEPVVRGFWSLVLYPVRGGAA